MTGSVKYEALRLARGLIKAEILPALRASIRIEALRLARRMVKEVLRLNGEKLNDYTPKDITKAAKALIEANPIITSMAELNMDRKGEYRRLIDVVKSRED